MPYEMQFEANIGVRKRFFGLVTINDVIQSSTELHRLPQFSQLHYSINDFSEIDRFDFDSVMPSKIVDLSMATFGAGSSNPKFRILVVNQNPRLDALVHRYMVISGNTWPVAFFQTLGAAREWAQMACTSE